MSEWVAAEREQVALLIEGIASCSGAPRRTRAGTPQMFRLSEALPLLEGMSSTQRALMIRQLCRNLGFDEHWPFQWRVEHKLVQAVLLDYFCPGEAPVTRGLGRMCAQLGPLELRAAIEAAFPGGYYIKTALGDSSGEQPFVDRTRMVVLAIERGELVIPPCSEATLERWVIQERVQIATEYRVHSLEDLVIDDLTYHRYGRGDIAEERAGPNAYVQQILDRLPGAIVGGSLLGWDVALTKEGRYVVIEVNFTGCHPVHRAGFQASGYYQDIEWGAHCTSRLLRFIERTDGVEVTVAPDCPQMPNLQEFYTKVLKWGLLSRAASRGSA